MAGLMGTLNVAKSGMTVSQVAIQTTSHNISNINTPGYTRQRVNQSASSAYSRPGMNSGIGAGQVGTGATVNSITRIRNSFYDYQFRSESHSYGDTSVKYEYYKNMESIFNEPSDTAISASMNQFFNAWNELSKDPNSTGAKNVVIENAKYLASNINGVQDKLGSLQDSANNQTESILKEINSMMSELKELEKNIQKIEGSGRNANDLLDQKDALLDELSFKLNITDGDIQNVLKEVSDAGRELTLDDLDGLNISGELQGSITMSEELEKFKGKMESFTNALAQSVNDVAGQEIFVVDDTTGKISVNPELTQDVDKLEISADTALKLYNLKSEKITIDGKEVSINNFYNNMIQELGQASQTVIKQESNQSKLLENIDGSRTSVSGVSMDEEMIGLIQLQHAYNANAKVISTLDSLLDVVVNGLMR